MGCGVWPLLSGRRGRARWGGSAPPGVRRGLGSSPIAAPSVPLERGGGSALVAAPRPGQQQEQRQQGDGGGGGDGSDRGGGVDEAAQRMFELGGGGAEPLGPLRSGAHSP